MQDVRQLEGQDLLIGVNPITGTEHDLSTSLFAGDVRREAQIITNDYQDVVELMASTDQLLDKHVGAIGVKQNWDNCVGNGALALNREIYAGVGIRGRFLDSYKYLGAFEQRHGKMAPR